MKKLIFSLLLIFTSISSYSQSQIAGCENPKGFVYYPYLSPTPKDKTGWVEDGITGGKSILVKNSSGQLDILFTDRTGRPPVSSLQDGGKVILLRNTYNQISVLINYESVTEIYTYWKTTDGKLQYSLLQSKGSLVSKNGVMVGSCQFINFNF